MIMTERTRHILKAFIPVCSFIVVSMITGCSVSIESESPHYQYEKSLEQAGLIDAALGREWLLASEKTLRDTLYVKLPFKESGYFFADRANALSYIFECKKGEHLVIKAECDSVRKVNIFLDLFSLETEEKRRTLKRAGFAEQNNLTLEFEVKRDQKFLLRLQSELMRSGRYTISITIRPRLIFPVKGITGKSIGGVFGDNRDGGRRKHEGVDIMAPRGTEALAISEGVVSRRTNNGLGGKVIWIEGKDNKSFYYAHLDEQLVKPGDYVKVGETIGLVGSTGNASASAPHLHFGIYMTGLAPVNPMPFIDNSKMYPPDISAQLNTIGEWGRIKLKKAVIKDSPNAKGKIITHVEVNTPMELYAAEGDYYRVKLPDNREGFIDSKFVESAVNPETVAMLSNTKPIFDSPGLNGVVIEYANPGQSIKTYGEFNGYYFVKVDNYPGWLSK